MTPPLFPHPRFQKLPLPTVIALVVASASIIMPMSAQPASRSNLDGSKHRPVASTNPTRIERTKNTRPDPRYRPPTNFSELQAVAGEVARTTGRKIHWHLKLGGDPGPLARIQGGMEDCTIYIHPIAARKVPPNTWAFIFGHEFAHLVEKLGAHSQTNPANELKADLAGARYAMAAGYRLDAFLGWVLTEPNQTSVSHGSLHQRVQAIASRFGVAQNMIEAEAKRYSRYRAAH